jgi:mono/diheme cytochrome c family protein
MCVACQVNELCRSSVCEVFDGGEYDANFPGPRDASINFDAGLFDGGPMPIDAGRPDSGVADAGRPDAGAADAGRTDAGMTVDAGPPVSFATNIVPIFNTYCVSCHTDRATYSNARARVVPGSPLTSVIYQRISGIAGTPMPQGGQLSNDDPAATALIERWILQGAPSN